MFNLETSEMDGIFESSTHFLH